MTTLINLLLFILFFGLMLFLHELGHFLVAKLFKIKVEEFGFGYPPRIVKLFKFGETDITINWIPFGAFVRLSGETDPGVKGGFGDATPWQRIAVLSGGPIMNIVTGVLLFTIIFTQVGIPDPTRVMIESVVPETPAQQSGLLAGDIVQSINQTAINDSSQLIQMISDNKGKEIEIVVDRQGQTVQLSAMPRVEYPKDQGALGITITNPYKQTSWIATVPQAFAATYNLSVQILRMPIMLLRGEVPAEQARVVGPVGLGTMFFQSRQKDIENQSSTNPVDKTYTLRLITLLSVAIGLTNLFPLPALDGGRILFILPEIIFRKRVPAKYENFVHMIGFFLLILLMFWITFQDILNPVQLP